MVAKPNINGTARSERIKYDALFVIGSGIFFSPGATPTHERQLDGQWGRHGGGCVCASARALERNPGPWACANIEVNCNGMCGQLQCTCHDDAGWLEMLRCSCLWSCDDVQFNLADCSC